MAVTDLDGAFSIMSNRGSITLGELVSKLIMLEINSHRCERHGRVSLARLIKEHGANMWCPERPQPGRVKLGSSRIAKPLRPRTCGTSRISLRSFGPLGKRDRHARRERPRRSGARAFLTARRASPCARQYRALPPITHQQFRARGQRDECTSSGSGMHIVEVRRDGGDVAEPMGRMRNWLDEHRIAPQLFTFTRLSSGSTNFCLGHWKNWVWVKLPLA